MKTCYKLDLSKEKIISEEQKKYLAYKAYTIISWLYEETSEIVDCSDTLVYDQFWKNIPLWIVSDWDVDLGISWVKKKLVWFYIEWVLFDRLEAEYYQKIIW